MTSTALRSTADAVIVALGPPGERARTLLRRHGLRCTAPRVAVLASLATAPPPGHRTAAEILQTVNDGGVEINLTTVYRAVSTLQSKGILHQLTLPDAPASYGLAELAHHHAVCTNCSAVSEVGGPDFAASLAQAHRSTLFTFGTTGSVTLYGLCPDCQSR